MMKRHGEAEEEANQVALGFLLELGTLEECEVDAGNYVEGDGDLDQAYRTAGWKAKRGKLTLPPGDTLRDFTDRLKAMYEENSPDHCPACEARDDHG